VRRLVRFLSVVVLLSALCACGKSEEAKPARPAGAVLSGSVVFKPDEQAEPKPDAGARAYLFRRFEPTRPLKPQAVPDRPGADAGSGVWLAAADAQGRYEIADLAPGAYGLVIVSAAAARDASARYEPELDLAARAEDLRRQADAIRGREPSAFEKSIALRQRSIEYSNLAALREDVLGPHFAPGDQAAALARLGADVRKFQSFGLTVEAAGGRLERNANFGTGRR
jgi:hypothetical protein